MGGRGQSNLLPFRQQGSWETLPAPQLKMVESATTPTSPNLPVQSIKDYGASPCASAGLGAFREGGQNEASKMLSLASQAGSRTWNLVLSLLPQGSPGPISSYTGSLPMSTELPLDRIRN